MINYFLGVGYIHISEFFILQPSCLAFRVLIQNDLLFHIQVGIGEGVSPSAATDLIARYVPLQGKCVQHLSVVLQKLISNSFCAIYFLSSGVYVMEFIELYMYAPFLMVLPVKYH